MDFLGQLFLVCAHKQCSGVLSDGRESVTALHLTGNRWTLQLNKVRQALIVIYTADDLMHTN